jgi:hypothetical protein
MTLRSVKIDIASLLTLGAFVVYVAGSLAFA